MHLTVKIMAILTLGTFLFYACKNEAKPLETPTEVADAIRKRKIKAVSTWLKNGGNPNQMIQGSSLLYIATGPKGSVDMTKLLLENGANVHQGAGKYTPLMNAASWTSLPEVKLLLEKGADKNLTNEDGKTAYELIGDCGDCPEQAQLQKLLKTTNKNATYLKYSKTE